MDLERKGEKKDLIQTQMPMMMGTCLVCLLMFVIILHLFPSKAE